MVLSSLASGTGIPKLDCQPAALEGSTFQSVASSYHYPPFAKIRILSKVEKEREKERGKD